MSSKDDYTTSTMNNPGNPGVDDPKKYSFTTGVETWLPHDRKNTGLLHIGGV